MAASSQVSQKKRGRDEYLNSGLPSPNAKRTNSGTLGHDSDLMALLDKIDTMGNRIIYIPEDTHTAMNGAEEKMRLNGVINSLEDEIWLKVQPDHNNIESSDERGSTEQMASNKQREFTADGDSEATSVRFDIEDFTYYNDVCGELGFFVDHFTPYELGIMQNRIDGDPIPDIRYSNAVDGYVETTDCFYGSLWEDELWHFNEYPVIQNDFASQQPEESAGSSGAEFHDVWV